MQWSSDRNAGFSRADPARLYFPVIMDPVYGYESINVEAQERSPFSLLQWMKRMIALRRQYKVFGRGSLDFIRTDNRKVLTYVRRYEGDVVLCVANLSRSVQPVEIPLAQFAGLTPVELLGQTEFPRVTEQPYFLTLAPYGFYWFQLQEAVVPMTSRTAPLPEEHAALPALFAGVVWDSVLDGSMRTIIERQALKDFVQRQRWFAGKARPLASVRFIDWLTLRPGAHPAFLAIVEAEYRDGTRERYALALAMASGADAESIEQHHSGALLARITGARKGIVYDGLFDDGTCAALLSMMRDGHDVSMRFGRLRAVHPGGPRIGAETPIPISRTAPDQSNTSVIFGHQLIMKMFRRLEPGPNPDVEIGAYLTARGFSRVPPLLEAVEYQRSDEDVSSVLMLQHYVPNQGNGWQVTVEEVERYFDRTLALPPPTAAREQARRWLTSIDSEAPGPVVEVVRSYLATAEILGRRTGELHVALAADAGNPAFAPEPYTQTDVAGTAEAMKRHAEERLRLLEAALPTLDERRAAIAAQVLTQRDGLLHQFDDLKRLSSGAARIRCHGDYHLGQVLVTEGDVVILDFEGEPARPISERREKSSPLRDVAGMLRSFSYASLTALGAATAVRPEAHERLAPWADYWEEWVSAAFLRAYLAAVGAADFLPSASNDLDTLLQAFVLDKALYELGYELNNRPDWVHIPLTGLLRLRSPLHA
jgi:maltose alpha-D-glucosyltransferase/alpha-amylase